MAGKKGSAQDILLMGIFLLVISVVTLLMFKISDEITTKFDDSGRLEAHGTTAMTTINNMYSGVLDHSFLLLTIGLAITAFILAALVRIHPMFIGIFVIILALIIFLSGIFSNIYTEIAANPDLSAIADRLVFISLIMKTLPFIVGIFGSLLAIVMYKTWKSSGY